MIIGDEAQDVDELEPFRQRHCITNCIPEHGFAFFQQLGVQIVHHLLCDPKAGYRQLLNSLPVRHENWGY